MRQGTPSTKDRRGCDRRKWTVPCWGPKKRGTSGPRGDRSRAPTALSFGWQPGRLLLCPQSPLCATAQRAGSSRIRGCWREGRSPVLGGPMRGLHRSLPPSSRHSGPWSLETPRLPPPPSCAPSSLEGDTQAPWQPWTPSLGALVDPPHPGSHGVCRPPSPPEPLTPSVEAEPGGEGEASIACLQTPPPPPRPSLALTLLPCAPRRDLPSLSLLLLPCVFPSITSSLHLLE